MHEGDSSSPNDNLTIIELKKARRGNVQIILSDNTSFFINEIFVLQFSLYEGKIITQAEISGIRHESLYYSVEQKALSYLSSSLYSTQVLIMKLLKNGFPQGVINEICRKLQETGYLDDEQFARMWVKSRIEIKPMSRNLLLSGLLKRGIKQGMAKSVLLECYPIEQEKEAAARFLNNPAGLKMG
ncbi:MAG: RecX family transcriptional regulator, partial [Spirochaetales bacterium]|nr:RecX family transcriptional regulator [Spirochaetales bacterium]